MTVWKSRCDRGAAHPDELEAELREIGTARYHNLHPFHRMLHDGKLDRGQVQAWALNRFTIKAGYP
jgi:pyrroloquinoline-quinone synthase